MSVPSRDGAENMARDMILLDRARTTGECVLSVYTWSRPTLSFGRNQAASGFYDQSKIRSRSLDLVRRPTGGRSILHHREVTYSITGSDRYSPTLGGAYSKINAILIHGLQELGVPVELSSPARPTRLPDQSPCFHVPARGELVVDGRKLVGSAQYRENGAFLQHGSILLADDQGILDLVMSGQERDSFGHFRPASLTGLLGRPVSPEEVGRALFRAVCELEDPEAAVLDESEVRDAALLLRPHFTDPLWTWRR